MELILKHSENRTDIKKGKSVSSVRMKTFNE